MRIGIVTFYRVANYGAMLQAYALWKYLEGQGHEVIFIRNPVTAPAQSSLIGCFASRNIEGIRKKLKSHVRHVMTGFTASYPQTDNCRTWEDLLRVGKTCDAFVVGSDQMWNPIWCSGKHLRFVMLDFAVENAKRISYAVSFGVKTWRRDQNATEAACLLGKFNAIGVRETSGLEIVEELSGRTDAKCLLDPTLLHSADFYRRLFDVRENKERYIFNYLLDEWSDSPDEALVLGLVQKKLNIGQVFTDKTQVTGWRSLFLRYLNVTSKVPVPEWLSRIANAEFVVTNSFHGTVFAILFHRPFIALLLKGRLSGMNERITCLLERLGLSSRAFYASDNHLVESVVLAPIDWENADRSLGIERQLADEFFKNLQCEQDL